MYDIEYIDILPSVIKYIGVQYGLKENVFSFESQQQCCK